MLTIGARNSECRHDQVHRSRRLGSGHHHLLGGSRDDWPNRLPATDGWNYVARLYRPRGRRPCGRGPDLIEC